MLNEKFLKVDGPWGSRGTGCRFEDFTLDGLIGQLRRGVNGAQSVHAYLFCGPQGPGKLSLAQICAQGMNCAAPLGQRPCGKCGPCQRYLHGTYPDHILIEGEKSIKVDDVRALIDRLSLRPYEGGRHTVIIQGADKMTPQAQNALLKTLEEPPGDAMLFLVAEKAASLLPTILSRVRLIRFSPLEEADCAQALRQLGVAAEEVEIFRGSPGSGKRWPWRDEGLLGAGGCGAERPERPEGPPGRSGGLRLFEGRQGRGPAGHGGDGAIGQGPDGRAGGPARRAAGGDRFAGQPLGRAGSLKLGYALASNVTCNGPETISLKLTASGARRKGAKHDHGDSARFKKAGKVYYFDPTDARPAGTRRWWEGPPGH